MGVVVAAASVVVECVTAMSVAAGCVGGVIPWLSTALALAFFFFFLTTTGGTNPSSDIVDAEVVCLSPVSEKAGARVDERASFKGGTITVSGVDFWSEDKETAATGAAADGAAEVLGTGC